MTGGYHTGRQRDRDRTLAERAELEPADQGSARTPATAPRPCWIHWHEPTEGHVLTWQRDALGRWWALVTASLPQEAVTPRTQGDTEA